MFHLIGRVGYVILVVLSPLLLSYLLFFNKRFLLIEIIKSLSYNGKYSRLSKILNINNLNKKFEKYMKNFSLIDSQLILNNIFI